MREFGVVAVGGTFDELHRGHKTLLTKAFELGQYVKIGLSSDEFAARMGKPHETASYFHRMKDLKAFLRSLGLFERAEIIALNDAFGIAASDKSLEALIVSDETKSIAAKINEKRVSTGLNPVRIISIMMVPSQNCTPISTTKIRSGEIDHEGRLLLR